MSEVTLEQAQEYLSVIGAVMPPNVDDREWLLVLANAYRSGLIQGFDWDTSQGALTISLISEVFPEYAKWRDENEIDPDTFARP